MSLTARAPRHLVAIAARNGVRIDSRIRRRAGGMGSRTAAGSLPGFRHSAWCRRSIAGPLRRRGHLSRPRLPGAGRGACGDQAHDAASPAASPSSAAGPSVSAARQRSHSPSGPSSRRTCSDRPAIRVQAWLRRPRHTSSRDAAFLSRAAPPFDRRVDARPLQVGHRTRALHLAEGGDLCITAAEASPGSSVRACSRCATNAELRFEQSLIRPPRLPRMSEASDILRARSCRSQRSPWLREGRTGV